MAVIAVSEADFLAFRELFYRRTGIQFEESKRYFVDRRLAERIAAAGCDSFQTYWRRLRNSPEDGEWQALINAMTVNETYFFREAYQFDCMVNSMLEELVARKTRNGPVRIWCVPCSTGEEPYSVAIYLLEKWALLCQYDVEIHASDIDTDVLEQAKRGIYSQRSVQYLPAGYLRKYFTPLGAGEYELSADLRQAVRFFQTNLLDPGGAEEAVGYDVVFCRNLLIYFDDISRRRAAQMLFDALNPGGFVCLGHSESMSRISSAFVVRKFPEAIVYQKPSGGGV